LLVVRFLPNYLVWLIAFLCIGFFWASRFGGALRRLASGYPLHHLAALRASSVVPLLSLSLVAPMVRPRFAQLKIKN
jgi:hypothetical protein